VFAKLGGIRWQLILGSSAILIGVFAAAGLGVRQLTSSTLYGTVDRELATRAERTSSRLNRGEPADRAPRGPAPNRGNPYKPVVVMLDGSAPPGGDVLLAWDTQAVNATASQPIQTTRVIAYDEPFRILTIPYRKDGVTIGAIQVPYPIADIERSVQAVDRTLLMLSPIVLLIACGIAFWLTRRILQPVEQMTAAAERIGASTLSERLPVIGTDEFAALATTLNVLLSRLELAFAQKKRFVADASHELRTPLTRIKGVAGVARLEERFYRVDDARARSGPGDNDGTGLGLAICRAIVDSHGGTIRFTSEHGHGLEVMIHIPEGHSVVSLSADANH